MTWFALAGAAAAWLGTSGRVTGAWHVWRTRSAKDHSWPSLSLATASMALSLAYLAYLGNWLAVAGQAAALAGCLVIVVVKVRYGKGCASRRGWLREGDE